MPCNIDSYLIFLLRDFAFPPPFSLSTIQANDAWQRKVTASNFTLTYFYMFTDFPLISFCQTSRFTIFCSSHCHINNSHHRTVSLTQKMLNFLIHWFNYIWEVTVLDSFHTFAMLLISQYYPLSLWAILFHIIDMLGEQCWMTWIEVNGLSLKIARQGQKVSWKGHLFIRKQYLFTIVFIHHFPFFCDIFKMGVIISITGIYIGS